MPTFSALRSIAQSYGTRYTDRDKRNSPLIKQLMHYTGVPLFSWDEDQRPLKLKDLVKMVEWCHNNNVRHELFYHELDGEYYPPRPTHFLIAIEDEDDGDAFEDMFPEVIRQPPSPYEDE